MTLLQARGTAHENERLLQTSVVAFAAGIRERVSSRVRKTLSSSRRGAQPDNSRCRLKQEVKPIRNPDSAPGDWYIDTACIDCGASRHVAPDLVIDRNGKSVFARQPETPEEQLAAWRAVLVCPTASVRSETKQPRPHASLFPQAMTEGVWRCGFNARSSFGAHSY